MPIGSDPESTHEPTTLDASDLIRAFISYSHDSDSHCDNVLALADRLRGDGIDAIIDRYQGAPSEGWPRWMDKQMREADFVLLICTETYLRRVNNREEAGNGRGVLWEGHLMYQYLYDAGLNNQRFFPILLSEGDSEYIPVPLRGMARYVVSNQEGYEKLYRRLTNQPETVAPVLGKRKSLPPKKVRFDVQMTRAGQSSVADRRTWVLAITIALIATFVVSMIFKIVLGQGLSYGITIVGLTFLLLSYGAIFWIRRLRGAR